MAWTIRYAPASRRQLRRLDRQTAQRIQEELTGRIAKASDPRQLGRAKMLRASMGGLWRFRVGAYRIICDIQDDDRIIVVLRIGHRREVY
ncbi:MAG: type II toxin-antitoxin system RelE/ParE family toxin [Caldilineaceae bacterium]|nr:type II toxin-antitoxin system RelE/ParE family toxin [Caldilineaceae bacterium]